MDALSHTYLCTTEMFLPYKLRDNVIYTKKNTYKERQTRPSVGHMHPKKCNKKNQQEQELTHLTKN